jgi:gluconate 2-dehydrogenase gamma chain
MSSSHDGTSPAPMQAAHMTTLSRRDVLRRVACLMGGAISAPAVLGVLQGCSTDSSSQWQPTFLTGPQADTVAEIAEIMIPRTDTPGAKDVGVPSFIDLMLKRAFAEEDRARFVRGLNEFESVARTEYQKPFAGLEPSQRTTLVQRVHDAAVAEAKTLPATTVLLRRPFILMTKELTLLGYFTSDVGSSKVLQYDPVPGVFRACVPLLEAGNGKAWATDPPVRF